MLIDWFTVGAQALNFLILVWLMKRFLYAPVLAAIDAREAQIARRLADADAKEKLAQAERDVLAHQNELFDEQRTDLLRTASEAAGLEKARLIDEAGRVADLLTATRREALDREARLLDQAISRLVRDEVFEVARKALRDLASTDLESSMVAAFNRELSGMQREAKSTLGAALRSASEPVSVRSAFSLSPELQAIVRSSLNTLLQSDIPLQFETAPRLISGIELVANGQRLSWNLDDYLVNLEKRAADLAGVKAAPSLLQTPASTRTTKPSMPTPATA